MLALFPEREIYLRSGGTVKFVRVTSRLQLLVAAAILCALLGWAVVTLTMLAGRADMAVERALLTRQQADVASRAAKVSAYQKSAGAIAAELEARQDFMEKAVQSHLGEAPTAPTAATAPAAPKTSSATPEIGRLRQLEQRQLAFARDVTQAVTARARRAETALRSLGLNPGAMRAAQGGPFIPWRGQSDALMSAPEFRTMADALARMDALETSLLAVPSSRPTAAPMVTSSYGYRRDPFNGRAAFHAGIDFNGSYGQAIFAAAPGRISFVGGKAGYGNCLEIDHGNGLISRYAHLSGFTAKVGQTVSRGEQIARMGSTGRSTGTHLHFEVRLNDQPLNPRRFLEARQDVLQVQQIASARHATGRNVQASNRS